MLHLLNHTKPNLSSSNFYTWTLTTMTTTGCPTFWSCPAISQIRKIRTNEVQFPIKNVNAQHQEMIFTNPPCNRNASERNHMMRRLKIYPLHLGHKIFLEIDTFLVVPLYKSSKETFIVWITSSPCCCLLLELLPPMIAMGVNIMNNNRKNHEFGLC